MFLTKDLPIADWSQGMAVVEGYEWSGTYRGHQIWVRKAKLGAGYLARSGSPRTFKTVYGDTIAMAARRAKCEIDFVEWIKIVPPGGQRDWVYLREKIEEAFFQNLNWLKLRKGGMRVLAATLGRHFKDFYPRTAHVWWMALPDRTRIAITRDIRACLLRDPPDVALWDQVVMGTAPAEAEPPPAPPPVGPPLKPKPKREWPALTIPAPEPYIGREFGHCKRCGVCLAFDVAGGCCTVCGAPLSKNPPPKQSKRPKRAKRGLSARARRLLRQI